MQSGKMQLETNRDALQATRDMQKATFDALQRCQQNAAETHAVGASTLVELEDQEHQLNKVLDATKELKDELKRADRLQNRFGRWSLQFNRKTAKRQVKQENEFLRGPTETAPKFKRRGPRPKKNGNNKRKEHSIDNNANDTPATMWSVDGVVEDNAITSKEITHAADKVELFAGRANDPADGRIRRIGKEPVPPAAKDAPLTRDEVHQLLEIDADDKAIDAGLDNVGNQLKSLLALSQTLGEAAERQHTKLDAIENDMAKAGEKAQVVNQRAKLFSMNRRQRRKENNKFKPDMSLLATG